MHNSETVRKKAIETIEKLEAGTITTQAAGATSRLIDNVIATVNLEMNYAHLHGKSVRVPFLDHVLKK